MQARKKKGSIKEAVIVAALVIVAVGAWLTAGYYRKRADMVLGMRAEVFTDNILFFVLTFLFGSLVMMIPCVLQMSLVFATAIAGVTTKELREKNGRNNKYKFLSGTFLFMLGFTATYAVLGLAIGVLGELLSQTRLILYLKIIGGALVAILGLHVAGILNLKFLSHCPTPISFLLRLRKTPTGIIGKFSLGTSFALYCAGCCGPYIYAILIFAGTTGSILTGSLLLTLFSIGMTIPFILIAVSYRLASNYLRNTIKHSRIISRASGTLLFLFAILLLVGDPLLTLLFP